MPRPCAVVLNVCCYTGVFRLFFARQRATYNSELVVAAIMKLLRNSLRLSVLCASALKEFAALFNAETLRVSFCYPPVA